MPAINQLFTSPSVVQILKILYYTGYFWLPALLLWLCFGLWVAWRRQLFFSKQTYIVLEIKLPREVLKSPRAAEFFITSLSSTTGEKNWYEKYWKGSVREWSSLEIASVEGAVHFFIWCRKGSRNKIESNLYAQYPGIEIYEVPDYTLPVSYNPETMKMYATEFELTKADPFPIKTYIDYGMDDNPKEEHKIDPLSSLVEAMGSLGRGQQAWFQIILRAHIKEEKDDKGEPVDLRWSKGAQAEIDKIYEKIKPPKGEDGKPTGQSRQPTRGESETIAALERSISKNGFDVGMRLIYFGLNDNYSPANIGGLVGGVTHFNSNNLNGFKPARGLPSEKYEHKLFAWKDRPKKKIIERQMDLLDAYKRREYFFPPHKSPHFILNTEELATIYHFPSAISMATPTLERIGSRKGQAPSNLPQ